jgi:MFS family permease
MGVFALGAHLEQISLVVVGLVLSGLGLGASSPALVSSVANAVDERDLGVANAALATVTQIGVVAGIQLMSALQAGGDGTAPFVVAYLAGGAAAAVGVAGAVAVRSSPRTGALRAVHAA